jgi:aminoglycoside 3-N-acetyltransferase
VPIGPSTAGDLGADAEVVRATRLNRTQLVGDLRKLGLEAGDIVMLHASMRAVGAVIGGPDEVHLAVEEAAGPGGTLLMYIGCEDGFDDVGRGVLSPEEERVVLAHQPPFDFQAARASRAFGILAEFFRSYPGTHMSQSVCGRMAARGARAAWLTADQAWNYGFGLGSPLDKLCRARGKVLLIGSDHDEVTLLHLAEHIADFDDKRIARYKVPIVRDGTRAWLDCEEFDTSERGAHASWPKRFFAEIVDDFLAKNMDTGRCRRGPIGNADSILLDAAALVDHAIPLMIRQAHA